MPFRACFQALPLRKTPYIGSEYLTASYTFLNSQELIKSGVVSVAVSNKISVEDLWKKYKDDNVLMGDVMAERYCFYFEKTIDVKKIHYFSLLTPKCCFCKKCNAIQYPCQQSINELEAMIKKCYEKSKMDPTVFENKIRKNFALIICKKNRGREQISFDNKSKTDKYPRLEE